MRVQWWKIMKNGKSQKQNCIFLYSDCCYIFTAFSYNKIFHRAQSIFKKTGKYYHSDSWCIFFSNNFPTPLISQYTHICPSYHCLYTMLLYILLQKETKQWKLIFKSRWVRCLFEKFLFLFSTLWPWIRFK